MRTRAENAARKGLRLLNERKAEKAELLAAINGERRGAPVVGERFDQLTAIEPADSADGRLRWVFQCDCGARVTWQVSTVRSNVKRLGWCSCASCYHAAGGWSAISKVRSDG